MKDDNEQQETVQANDREDLIGAQIGDEPRLNAIYDHDAVPSKALSDVHQVRQPQNRRPKLERALPNQEQMLRIKQVKQHGVIFFR